MDINKGRKENAMECDFESSAAVRAWFFGAVVELGREEDQEGEERKRK